MRAITAVAIVLTLALASAVAAQSVKPTRLSVYDANGKKVGRLLGFVGYPNNQSLAVVAISVSGRRMSLLMGADSFRSVYAGGSVYFESADCSGPPLMLQPTPALEMLSPVELNGPNKTLYLGDNPSTPQDRTTHSYLNGTDGSCATQTQLLQTISAVRLVDMAPQFTPPFSVR